MTIRNTLLALALTTSYVGLAAADDHHPAPAHEGEDLNVHNNTGHEVIVFLFQDDHVHLNEKGGTQVADIKDKGSAVAHVPNCKFSVILIDHEDVWHAEFHDCHSTDMTFTKDTNHAKKAK
jgi:hypothetical protein